VADSLRPHELYSPQNSPGQNTIEGNLSLLQGIFSTQGSNPGLPHCRWILYQLSHREAQTTVIAQNNSHTKACVGVACAELLQSLWMAFSAALQVHPISIDARPAGTAQRGSSHIWVGCMPQKQRAPVLPEQGMVGGRWWLWGVLHHSKTQKLLQGRGNLQGAGVSKMQSGVKRVTSIGNNDWQWSYLHIGREQILTYTSVLIIYQEKRKEDKIDKQFLQGEVLEIYHP